MSKYSPEYLTHMNRKPMSLNAVKQAIENKAILEAKVIKCNSEYELTVEIGKNIIGKIPFDELEYHINNVETKRASATSKVNKHIKFMPLDISEENGIYIVKCSRKKVQELCYNNYIKKLSVGDIIDAEVTKIVGYGIFCDIGCGIIALLPTNNISVTHIVDTTVELKGVTNLKVIVKSIDENYRIELTHRELLGTWEQEVSKFNEGDIVHGTVLSIEDYGVFIRLSQNLSGLADNSNNELKPGDTVNVKVQSIQSKNMKVKLSVIEKVGNIENEPMKFGYYITEPHIKDWVYSTSTAKKQIESHFITNNTQDIDN